MPILLWLLLFFLIAVVVGTAITIYKKANAETVGGTPEPPTTAEAPDGSA
jgi:hypothetical protein